VAEITTNQCYFPSPMAMGSSDGDRRRILLGVIVAKVHVGSSVVMDVYCPHGASALGVSYQSNRAALFRDDTALSRRRRSHEKRL